MEQMILHRTVCRHANSHALREIPTFEDDLTLTHRLTGTSHNQQLSAFVSHTHTINIGGVMYTQNVPYVIIQRVPYSPSTGYQPSQPGKKPLQSISIREHVLYAYRLSSSSRISFPGIPITARNVMLGTGTI